MPEPTRRGPYAKGIARRQQILREALAAYAESDSTGPSLRAIAKRTGLSERGLLHYFPARDELFVAILAERDAADRASFDPDGPLDDLAAVTAHTAKTPGLVRLFLEMTAAAPDPEHAAHGFFTRRYRELREILARKFTRSPRPETPPVDADFAARVLIAASDGLQAQWLLDPSIDLEDDLDRLARLLQAAR
ncbi:MULTISPECIES: TetR/AcrR family transcriptional regulator [unclassified Amycolatopsis]|uniref:TetR/AcrR family transcriptional regulator n=1 Tax=unclassified Amycolatopsis TaxID=2618356 RepID=UPI002E12382F|nr:MULTISPECIES: TetR family transcriptional regulator [unclassified Amycolatopsis]WSJ73351.1 TetR family transcriptional regulator [Amycolatopsis sp. NBC_01307]WSK82994.1 TetR family transcriptional regulator [Amycolatopsis sp. NBC_01286]